MDVFHQCNEWLDEMLAETGISVTDAQRRVLRVAWLGGFAEGMEAVNTMTAKHLRVIEEAVKS